MAIQNGRFPCLKYSHGGWGRGGCDTVGPGKKSSPPHPSGRPRHPMAAGAQSLTLSSLLHPFQHFILISTDLKYETSLKHQPSFHGWEGLNLISGQWKENSAPWLPVWGSSPGSEWPLMLPTVNPDGEDSGYWSFKILVKCLVWKFSFSRPQGPRGQTVLKS